MKKICCLFGAGAGASASVDVEGVDAEALGVLDVGVPTEPSPATYLSRNASRNDLASSLGLEGLMNEPAVTEGEDRQEKYLMPLWVPVCLPSDGLSHSTPSQVPDVPGRGPW